jgi:hypothetical protein
MTHRRTHPIERSSDRRRLPQTIAACAMGLHCKAHGVAFPGYCLMMSTTFLSTGFTMSSVSWSSMA